MNKIKKIGLMVVILLWIVGLGGGFMVAANAHEPFVAVSVLVLGAVGFPSVKRIFERLTQ